MFNKDVKFCGLFPYIAIVKYKTIEVADNDEEFSKTKEVKINVNIRFRDGSKKIVIIMKKTQDFNPSYGCEIILNSSKYKFKKALKPHLIVDHLDCVYIFCKIPTDK